MSRRPAGEKALEVVIETSTATKAPAGGSTDSIHTSNLLSESNVIAFADHAMIEESFLPDALSEPHGFESHHGAAHCAKSVPKKALVKEAVSRCMKSKSSR